MDEIDFSICMMLMWNSRIPYRELAETFNMSVNSIHKRIKSMVNMGIIQNFNTKISGAYFKVINVVMFGISKAKNRDELLEKLGEKEYIYNVTYASGNLIYIHAFIRNFNEVDSLVSFVRKEGEINELTVGLDSNSPSSGLEDFGDISFSELDFLIINALKNNSRKTVSDIAYEVGISTKTVTRHLNRLIERKLIKYSIDWYPDKSAIVMSIINLQLNPSANVDKLQLMEKFRAKFGKKVLISWTFSNLPNTMLVLVWTNKMQELQELETSLRSETIDSVNVTVLLKGMMFSTWQDKYLDEKIKEIKGK